MAATKPDRVGEMIHRTRAEYLEMPGLCLTRSQAARLLGLDERACTLVLGALVAEGFLYEVPRGRFARVTTGTTRPIMRTGPGRDDRSLKPPP